MHRLAVVDAHHVARRERQPDQREQPIASDEASISPNSMLSDSSVYRSSVGGMSRNYLSPYFDAEWLENEAN